MHFPQLNPQKSINKLLNKSRFFLKAGHRRRTLILVATQTVILTVTFLSVFIVHEYHNINSDLAYNAKIIVNMFFTSFILWLMATCLVHATRQKLTHSLIDLSTQIRLLEHGKINVLEINYKDSDIQYLVGAITRLIVTLKAREEANIALTQQLLDETVEKLKDTEDKILEKTNEFNRMSSLGIMASYMAHEINNLVGSMILNLELLKDAFEDSRKILKDYFNRYGNFTLGGLEFDEYDAYMPGLIEEMYLSAQKIKQIINDLKHYEKNEPINMSEDIDVNDIIRRSLQLTIRKINDATENFELNLMRPLPYIRGNAHQLEQVIINLLINACQALPDMTKKIKVSSSYELKSHQVVVIVYDEGQGISSALVPHLTDPFFTTKRDKGGTGIGLAISSKIIKDHGASIEFESDIDKGMTVTVKLPVPYKRLS